MRGVEGNVPREGSGSKFLKQTHGIRYKREMVSSSTSDIVGLHGCQVFLRRGVEGRM